MNPFSAQYTFCVKNESCFCVVHNLCELTNVVHVVCETFKTLHVHVAPVSRTQTACATSGTHSEPFDPAHVYATLFASLIV